MWLSVRKLWRNLVENHPRPEVLRRRRRRPFSRARSKWELLEDRCLLSGVNFIAVFDGIAPGYDLQEQVAIGQDLLESSGVSQEYVQVTQALDLSGTFVVQTPTDVTQETLSSELQAVPGFVFVDQYNPVDDSPSANQSEEDPGGDLVDEAAYDQRLEDFNYLTYTSQENAGLIPDQSGAVTSAPAPVDTLGNNNTGSSGTRYYTQSETTLVASGNTVVVGFNDSGSYATGGNKFTGFSYSTDGGATFTDGGVLPTNPRGDLGDPVLARNDATGRIYFATLQFNPRYGVNVFHSDDNGVNWSSPAEGAPGKFGSQDKEWIAVDNFSGSGNGNVYLVERDFGSGNGIYFYRSTDNGATFGPYGGTFITYGWQGAFVAVAPDHSVDVFWWQGSTLQMRKSTNQGLTFGAPVTVASGLYGGTNGDLGLIGYNNGEAYARTIRSNSFPHAAVNPVNGDIYVTYNSNPAGIDKADVYFVQSTDGGATWTAPVRVNDDSTTTDQWQPTIAVTPDGSKLGIFYYSRQEDTTTADGDPANNQFKYYGRIGDITGSTVSFAPSFAVSDTPSKPEVGRDGVVNSTYMGDYNQVVATPSTFHVTWSDNRDDLPGGGTRKDPNVYYKTISLGLEVTGSTPAAGSTLTTQPATFAVTVTDAVDPASLQPDDFEVNGIKADTVDYTPGSKVITFGYATTPVTTQGLQTMHVDAGAFTRPSDGDAVGAFDASFRYDATLLAVDSTVPPFPGGVFTLPGPFNYDVKFNENVDSASVQASDLSLSGIAGATVTLLGVSGDTAHFQIGGISQEGEFTAAIAAGAVTDIYGNANPSGFSAGYAVDVGTVSYPTPLLAEFPLGSQIYDPSVNGYIAPAGDTDSYTIDLDAGQKLTVVLDPATALQGTIELLDPSGTKTVSAASAAAGTDAVLQNVPITTAGTYTVNVGGAGGTIGAYGLRLALNAQVEAEQHDGPQNNTLAAAENIDGSFLALGGAASRGAVLGTMTATDPFLSEDFEAGVLPASFSTYSSNTYGRIRVAAPLGSGNSSGYALLMDSRYSGYYALNEAVYTVDLTGLTRANLSFKSINYNDEGNPLPANFTGHYSGDGVAISDDGVHWHTVLSAPTNGSWQTTTIDLADAAASAGMSLGAGFQIKFQQYDNFPISTDGRGYDDIAISVPQDVYSFSLSAGDTATLALNADSSDAVDLTLVGPDGVTQALATAGAENVDRLISDFQAADGGTYYAVVNGEAGTDYRLLVTRNADFDTEGNNNLASSQDVLSRQVGGEQRVLGYVVGGSDLFDLRGAPVSGSLILSGSKLTLGINADGSFITAPGQTGIQFLGNEFVTPGTPVAGFTIGRNGVNYSNHGAQHTTQISVAKEDLSYGSFHGVRIVGTVGGNLQLERVIAFNDGDEFATIATRLTNLTGSILTNVATLENLDPDPGQPLGAGYATYNDVVLGGQLVRADAKPSAFPGGLTIGLGSTDPRRVVSAEGFDNRDPFQIINSPSDPNGAYGDIAINLAVNFGNLGAFESVSSSTVMTFGRTTAEAESTYLANASGGAVAEPDVYKLTAAAADQAFHFATSTPAGGGGEFVNSLDPRLRILDALGAELASADNNGSDGRNAALDFTAPAAGSYYVEVSASDAASTKGEYVLTLTGNSVTAPLFQVTATDLADGAKLRTAPGTITVDFNDSLLLPTLSASDLTIDGVAATDFTIVDADTVRFDLPAPLADGTHAVNIAAGAISDVQGTPVGAFSSSFLIDRVAPRVVATSLAPDDVVAPGALSYQVTFSEPMDVANLSADDFALRGNLYGVNYVPSAYWFNADGTALTLNYLNLPDDHYTLTLYSGVSGGLNFTDLVGNSLDGEFSGSFPSGNGTPGGNFVIGFDMDYETEDFPTSFTSLNPPGSLIYDPSMTRTVAYAGDTDSFTLAVDPGQTITLLVTAGSPGLQPTVELRDPSQTVVGSAAAAAAGENALLQTVAATAGGDYTVTVGGAGGTTGIYEVEMTLNAALEAESHGDAANNTRDTAQNLDDSFLTLQTPTGSAQRGAVLGQTDPAGGYTVSTVPYDFEDISTTGHSILQYSNNSYTVVSPGSGFSFNFYGTSYDSLYVGSNGLITFGSGNSSPVNYDLTSYPSQATIAPFWDDLYVRNYYTPSSVRWEVLGSGADQHLVIQWNDVSYYGYTHDNPITFEAVLFADGSIRFNYQNLTAGSSYHDEGGSATVGIKAAGTQGPDRILLAYNDGPNAYVGSGKSTLIAPVVPTADYYSFSLGSAESATLALKSQGGAGELNLELLNPDGTKVATGAGADNLTKVIGDFTAGAAGTYYARVTGDGDVPYSLVVTRDAAFDTENNGSFATAQNLTGLQGVLGGVNSEGGPIRVAVFGNGQADDVVSQLNDDTYFDFAATQVNSAAVLDSATELANYDVVILGDPYLYISAQMASALRTWVESGEGGVVATGDTYYNTLYRNYDYYSPQTKADLDAILPLDMSNHYPYQRLFFSLGITDSSHPITDGVTDIGRFYGDTSRTGVDAGATVLASYDYFGTPLPLISAKDVGGGRGVYLAPDFVYYDTYHNFRTGSGDRLLEQAVHWAAPPPDVADWYSIHVADTDHALRLDTSTPADAAGAFVNTLDPKIELYDPSGMLVASGKLAADGRNEFIQYTPLTTGDYRVRVTAEAGTSGEYFLSKNFSPVVTALNVTSPIDEGHDASLAGSFTDPDSLGPHTVTITWGPGEGSSTLNLAAGISRFSTTHFYADDNPTATPSDDYPISVVVTDNHGATGAAAATVTVNDVAPNVSPNVVTQSVQYSDSIDAITFTARDVPADVLHAHVFYSTDGGTTFTPGLPDAASIAGGLSFPDSAVQVGTGAWTIAGIADLAPGTYVLRVEVTDDDTLTGSAETTIVVSQENSDATYNGPLFVSTDPQDPDNGVIPLQVVVRDVTAYDAAHDPEAGLITQATVTFIDRDGGIIASGVPVNLIGSDPTVGVATYDWHVSLDKNVDAATFQVGVVVDNFYTGVADDTLITVARPNGNFITGGGYLVNQASAGAYAAGDGLKTNFGFNVKFNQSLTNLQGHFTAIVRRENGQILKIKSNATDTLGVDPTTGKADFQSKANLSDISDPLNPVSLGGNLQLYVNMTDGGESGTGDTLSFALWDGGTLLFSSDFDGAKSVEQALGSGALQVHTDAEALTAAGTVESGGSLLLPGTLQPLVNQAIGYWDATLGLSGQQLATLNNVYVGVADLPGSVLGLESQGLGAIWLDRDGGGAGWGSTSYDPLYTLVHEFGHALGFEHDLEGVMAESLLPGQRLAMESFPGARAGNAENAAAMDVFSLSGRQRMRQSATDNAEHTAPVWTRSSAPAHPLLANSVVSDDNDALGFALDKTADRKASLAHEIKREEVIDAVFAELNHGEWDKRLTVD